MMMRICFKQSSFIKDYKACVVFCTPALYSSKPLVHCKSRWAKFDFSTRDMSCNHWSVSSISCHASHTWLLVHTSVELNHRIDHCVVCMRGLVKVQSE